MRQVRRRGEGRQEELILANKNKNKNKNNTGNSFLNALGKARCSPSYTKFSPIAFREKEREKEKEKEGYYIYIFF